MKNLLFVFLGILATFCISCQELEKLTMFDLDYTASFTIPAGVDLDTPVSFTTPEIITNSAAEFANKNTRKDLLEEVLLTKLDLTITEPSEQGFDFLKSLHVYMHADSLTEIQIASAENIPDTIGSILEMEVLPTDLREYIKKEGFSLRVEAVPNKTLTENAKVDVLFRFHIDAALLPE